MAKFAKIGAVEYKCLYAICVAVLGLPPRFAKDCRCHQASDPELQLVSLEALSNEDLCSTAFDFVADM